MTERWAAIAGWPYEVSDLGRVRRGDRVLRATPIPEGYLTVTFCSNGTRRTMSVHRLVAEAFHGPAPTAAHVVAHADGTRSNNAATNLRWATPSENEEDKTRHGTRLWGERNHKARLTESQVRAIRSSGGRTKDLAAHYGVNRSTIVDIRRRHTWANLP